MAITVTSTKGITTTARLVGMQGEESVELDFAFDGTLTTYATGKYTYVEFLTSDGRVVEKGDYDASGGTFTVTILASDGILNTDSELRIQVVIRDAAEPATSSTWKSQILDLIVGTSI